MTFSDNLKVLRTKSRLKQQELAELLHVSQQTIAKWENGKSEPNITMLKDIAGIFNCSVNDLLDSNDDTEIDIISRNAIKEAHSPEMINFEKMCSELDEETLDRIHVILYSLRRLHNNQNIYSKEKQNLISCIAEIVGRVELFADSFQSL